jgi:hypothetical protein
MKKILTSIILFLACYAASAQTADTTYKTFQLVNGRIVTTELNVYQLDYNVILGNLLADSIYLEEQKVIQQNEVQIINKKINRIGKELKNLRLQNPN